MKTAREVAHELVGFRCSRDGKYHTAACDDGTAAIEARDGETVEACAVEAEKSAHQLSCGHPLCTAERCAAARIRSLAPPPGGTK